MTLLIIIGVLFISLILIVPLVEKNSATFNNEKLRGMSRWIFPALAFLLVLQLIRHYFF